MAEATRDRLLDAAERLFAEHGYQATTMRGLTAEAAANIAAVNYHFGRAARGPRPRRDAPALRARRRWRAHAGCRGRGRRPLAGARAPARIRRLGEARGRRRSRRLAQRR